MNAPASNASAAAAANLRQGTGTKCCATCQHGASRTGAQLVRCRLFDVLTRKATVCDRWHAREAD